MEPLSKNNYKDVKILAIVHKDFDGIGASIMLANTFPKENIEFYATTYAKIDNVWKNVDKDAYDYFIMADISPNVPELIDLTDKLILLDHHTTAVEYHNPKKNRAVVTENCATMLVKDYCETVFGKDLSHLQEFAKLANDYDMWILDDPRSWELNELFFKYWDVKFRQRFMDGNIELNEEEQKYINSRHVQFDRIWDKMEVFDIPAEGIKACFFREREMVNDLAHKLLKDEDYDYVFCQNPATKSISVRINDTGVHIGNILKELKLGGGHKLASGINSIYEEEVDSTLKSVCDKISEELNV